MTDETAAIQGTFATYKFWPSRNLLQLIIEVPAEKQEAVFAALGYPLPGSDIWVGIARLQSPVVIESRKLEAKARFAALSDEDKAVASAAILAKDKAFQSWAGVDDEGEAKGWIRAYCGGIISRSELATNANARALFNKLITDFKLATGRLPYEVGQ